MPAQPAEPDLTDASDTDEVYRLAYDLAAWGLRNGKCDTETAVDWVLEHPHEPSLPRGSRGRLNPTRHHITKGAEAAARNYGAPDDRAEFDAEPLHALAERISGSGVTHERYLLGVVALCHKFETTTPVITGPLLAQVVDVNTAAAGKVLAKWSTTLAYGFFTAVSYDGVRGHGRVWSVNTGWIPVSKPRHLPGCNRSAARCRCFAPQLSQNGISIFTAAKDRSTKVRHAFEAWVSTKPEPGKPGCGITVTDVCREFGLTRAAAMELLRSEQGGLLDEFTYDGGRSRRRRADGSFAWVRQGETWFRARTEKSTPA